MNLEGKRGLIFGIANHRSIAWGCARSLKAHGARLGVTYLNDTMEKRVRPLGEEIGAEFIERCDLTIPTEIDAVCAKTQETFGTIDFLVHSVAYASQEALSRPISQISQSEFQEALTISAWTFLGLAGAMKPLLNPGASLVTMTYYGSTKAIINYGIMGVAKAALEAEVRYLADELGEAEVRVNAISAGPIRTLAASGVKGFKGFLSQVEDRSAIHRSVTTEEVGNTCTYLVSPASSGVTGQVLYVDLGFSAKG
jgi:enoyl-[acyl-carrier protein] reductase I